MMLIRESEVNASMVKTEELGLTSVDLQRHLQRRGWT